MKTRLPRSAVPALVNPRRYYLSCSSEEASYDVDVFIPYYRNLHLVQQTIDSVLWQLNVKPLIHLVNDCSKEDDRALKRKYADTPNIRWYKTRQNCGPYKIANGLFHFMASETIAIVDSDDIMLPEHLDKALRALKEHEADVYGSCGSFSIHMSNIATAASRCWKTSPL